MAGRGGATAEMMPIIPDSRLYDRAAPLAAANQIPSNAVVIGFVGLRTSQRVWQAQTPPLSLATQYLRCLAITAR
jgi:hypothetical protein